jgi:predicted transcriptional regulator of viral defense system
MGDLRKSDAERRISAKAAGQEGVVSLGQAVDAGMSVRSAQRSPWLHRVTPGVYAVGHTSLSQRAYLWVAHLATGATISDESAAWDWGLLPKLTAPVHVTTAGHNRDRPGIKVHHRTRISPVDRDGLPVTSVAETLNTLPPNQLMRALREARYLGVLRPRELTGRAKRGWERISTVPPHRTRSELEHRLLDVCDTHGFPHPLVNHSVDGLERARP